MKELNTLANNVAKNFLKRDILLNTKGQYMKELNTLAGNVAIEHLIRKILPDTKGLYMRVSNKLWKHKIDVQLLEYSGTFFQIYDEATDHFNIIHIWPVFV